MTNPYGFPDAAGSDPTQPFWVSPGPRAGSASPGPAAPPYPAAGDLAGAAGLGPAASHAPNLSGHLNRDRRKALHWTWGLVAAALLAAGSAVAALSLAGHSSPVADQSQATPAGARQGALLNSALNRAGSPGALTAALGATGLSGASAPNGTQAGAPAPGTAGPLCSRVRSVASAAGQEGLPRLARRLALGAARCRIFRHRVFRFLLLRGVEGQFTIQTGQGAKTLAYERGVIETVNAGQSVTVTAADGTTWTWDLVSTTVIRDLQGQVPASDLAAGTPVWVGGPVVQGVKDARLLVLRPPTPAAAFASPTPGN